MYILKVCITVKSVARNNLLVREHWESKYPISVLHPVWCSHISDFTFQTRHNSLTFSRAFWLQALGPDSSHRIMPMNLMKFFRYARFVSDFSLENRTRSPSCYIESLMSTLPMCRLTDPLFFHQVFIIILKGWISYSYRSEVSLNQCDKWRSLTRCDYPFFSCQFLLFSRRWVSWRGKLGSLLCCKLQRSAIPASAAGKCKVWDRQKSWNVLSWTRKLFEHLLAGNKAGIYFPITFNWLLDPSEKMSCLVDCELASETK